MPLRFAEATAEAYQTPLTIRHLLDASMVTAADEEIVYRDKVRLTYRQLRERIGRLASALEAQGVEQGMTVAVMDWDSHRYLESYFAVPMMGAVLMMVNIRLPAEQIAYTLAHSKAEVVLCHRDFFPFLDALLPKLPGIKAVIAIDDGAGGALPDYARGEYEDLLAAADPGFAFEDFDENALATTFYTTGTTGGPKGVCFSHRQIVLLALACKGPFGASRDRGFGVDDVYMPLTPMFHVHAWCLPFIATLLGVKQVYPGRYEPDMICRLRREEGVTYSHCVPTILQMVLAAAAAGATIDLTGWTMTIGGSALTKALLREAEARGMSIHAGYGMSETAPTITIARHAARGGQSADEAAESLTTAGVPVAMVAIRIVDEEMNDVPHDGVSRGELVVRAPWLTPCYTGDAKASEALWRGGWLHTQDVATIDAQGRVGIRDRLKDVIKSGGEWISSLELEDVVAGVAGVGEAAVIGVPHPRWGERPVALVVPASGGTVDVAAIEAAVDAAIAGGRLGRYAKLDRIETVEALPRTSVGKIDKKALRAQLAAEAAPAEATAA